MKPVIILILGLLVIFVLIRWSIQSQKACPIDEIDKGLIEPYCQGVASGNYAYVYEHCLSRSYRKDMTLEDFAKAHGLRLADRGVLRERELIRTKGYSNLFTRTQSFQILYRLVYPEKEFREYVVVDNADGEWRIEGTYYDHGTGLDFRVW